MCVCGGGGGSGWECIGMYMCKGCKCVRCGEGREEWVGVYRGVYV